MFKTPQLFFEMLRKEHPELDENNYIDCIKPKEPDVRLLARTRCVSELMWRKQRRPYYKVYPKILSALCRVNLDLPISSIHYPVETLMILLPKGQTDLVCDYDQPLTALMVMLLRSPKDTVFSIMAYREKTEIPFFATGQMSRFGEDRSIEEALGTKISQDVSEEEHKVAITQTRKWTRLAVALSLLSKDTGLIIPDVINGEENHPRAAERAAQRGKIGWHVGRDIEVMPHVRIPHLCNQPCGPGSKNRKIIWREGSIIHKSKISSIPTGFEG